jgi:hypothetical protein
MNNKFSSSEKIIFAILIFFWFAPSHAVAGIIIDVNFEVPENVSFYEMEIKQAEDEDPRKIPPEPWKPTEEISLNISLLPGSYQVRIIFYDSENRRIGRTEWVPLEVPGPQKPIEVTIIIRPPGDTPFHLFIWPSWATFFPLYGGLVEHFGYVLFPPGPKLSFDIVASTKGAVSAGIELTAAWFYLNKNSDENKITSHMITIDFNFLAQIHFPDQRTTLSFHAGMGLTVLENKEPKEKAADLNPLTAQINAGVSFLWRIRDSSHTEIGVDFSHLLGWDAGCLRPWIGFGIRL